MFSDDLYKRLIAETHPTVEDKYGVHFEYDDLFARLLRVKQTQSNSHQVPRLPSVGTRTKRLGASTERAGIRRLSSNQLKDTYTLDLKSISPQRKRTVKSPHKVQTLMHRTISHKTASQKASIPRRSSGERIAQVYGGPQRGGRKIKLR
jgi:hypothetical protein